MRLLLDTHTFLWWITDKDRLSRRARSLIGRGDNEILFSAVSGWEIAVKAGLGRIDLPSNPEQFIPQQIAANAFEVLPIQLRHTLRVFALPSLHRDPFDRMLVAQAAVERLPILSGDPQFSGYPVEIVW